MLALLEPAGRAPELQAWFQSDLMGRAGDGFQYDCSPAGATSCHGEAAPDLTSFYCYNPYRFRSGRRYFPLRPASERPRQAYFLTIASHLRVNNDSAFLAGMVRGRNLTVDDALEAMALEWQDRVIPGTKLVDYGEAMDGFSPTYKHVPPQSHGA